MHSLKSVKVKRTQVKQRKKQKISMILNENKKTGKVVADVTSVGRLPFRHYTTNRTPAVTMATTSSPEWMPILSLSDA